MVLSGFPLKLSYFALKQSQHSPSSEVWVYGFKTLSLLHSIETSENPKGRPRNGAFGGMEEKPKKGKEVGGVEEADALLRIFQVLYIIMYFLINSLAIWVGQ